MPLNLQVGPGLTVQDLLLKAYYVQILVLLGVELSNKIVAGFRLGRDKVTGVHDKKAKEALSKRVQACVLLASLQA